MYPSDQEQNTFCNRQLFEYAIEGKSKKLQKIFERDGNIPIDTTNNKGQTLLYVSCLYQRLKVVALLLQFGADPNRRSDDGSTPTHAAAHSCIPEILRCIVEEYGGDMRLHDKHMRTPKDWAIRAGKSVNRKMIRLIEIWQDQVDEKMHVKQRQGLKKVSRSEEILKSNLKIDYCGYGSFLHSSRSQGTGYVGFSAVVPLASPIHITSPGNLSLSFTIPPSFIMEEALWCNHRVMIKRSKAKSLPLSRASEDLLIAEAKACRILRHPNLLLLMAICVTSPEESCSDATDYWLVYEHVRMGSLYHVLHVTKRNLLPSESAMILIQIAEALSFIHQRGFVHCCMSSHAIYLSHSLSAKLGDMCCITSTTSASKVENSSALLPHFVRWVAPEVILKDAITPKTDVYSFCVVICETFSGSIPWYGCDTTSIENHIKKRRNYFMTPDWLPAELLEMLRNGLKFHSYNRTVNPCDLQGCLASLLESGKFDKMVTCLNGNIIPSINISSVSDDSPSKLNRIAGGNYSPLTGDSVAHKPTALYSNILIDGGVCNARGDVFDPYIGRGEDVPDAKPIHVTEMDKISANTEALHKTDIDSRIETLHNCSADIIKDQGVKKIIHVTADVHKDSECTTTRNRSPGNHSLNPNTREDTHVLGFSSLQRRPHSCSILTRDGYARELLPNVRHNSFPDIPSETQPPSYSSAIGGKERYKGIHEGKLDNGLLQNITAPPTKEYTPRSSLPGDLEISTPDRVVTPSNSSKDAKKQDKGLQVSDDLSSSFPNTSGQLSIPCSLTSNLYPSSLEPKSELKTSDVPSTSVLNSNAKCSHNSESTDIPDSSFAVENAPPPDYVHLAKMRDDDKKQQSESKPAAVIQHSQSSTLPNPNHSAFRIAGKVEPTRKVLRTASYRPTREREIGTGIRKARWSTSALVGQNRINNGAFSTEEMYNIDHCDLEHIFESFAERNNCRSDASTSNSPVCFEDRFQEPLFQDKASQTELAHLQDIENQADSVADLQNVKGEGDDLRQNSMKNSQRSVFTNTGNDTDEAVPFEMHPEQKSYSKPICEKVEAVGEIQNCSKPFEVITHCNLMKKPPISARAAPSCISPVSEEVEQNPSSEFELFSAKGPNTSSSSEYLYSQEFIIPAHTEECTSSYEDRTSGNCSEGVQSNNLTYVKMSDAADKNGMPAHCRDWKDAGQQDISSERRMSSGGSANDQTQFVTCFELESVENPACKDAVLDTDSHTVAGSDVIEKNQSQISEFTDSAIAIPGDAGECVSNPELVKTTVDDETEIHSPKKLEGANIASETPSKWPFHKKLFVFKAVADNGSNLEKKVVTQNAFSKVRQTADMFESMSAPTSPRDALPHIANTSPRPSASDDTGSTLDSSKFFPERLGQNFDTSTPVSTNVSLIEKVQCRHEVNPRTFEEVRHDIEVSTEQKCYFAEGSDGKCAHDNQTHPASSDREDELKSHDVENGDAKSIEGNSLSTAFYTDQSFDELRIKSPLLQIKNMVQGMLSEMIQNALAKAENTDDHYNATCATVDSNSDSENDDSKSSVEDLPSDEPTPVKASKSMPSKLDGSGADDQHLSGVRMTQSVADIDSLLLDASNERFAQECSSYVSDMDEKPHGSEYYRSVDTSVWSL